MIFEEIKRTFLRSTRQLGKVDSFEEFDVDQKLIRDMNLVNVAIKGFTFVVDGSERYYVFYHNQYNQLQFTRAKEGIKKELIKVLYYRDFSLRLTGDVMDRSDIAGKLCELFLNRNARQDIFQIVDKFHMQYKLPGSKKEYSIGYKVIRYDKIRMLFDAEVVITVTDKGIKGTFETIEYNCLFINNKFNNAYQASNNVAVTMADIFGE